MRRDLGHHIETGRRARNERRRRTRATDESMPRRLRTLLGTLAILAFVIVYAVVVMALADSRLAETPKLVQTLIYMAFGVAWILPVMPLIKWMERS